MNEIIDFFQAHPLILGLLIGLLVALLTWIRGTLKAMSLRREIRRLKDGMYTRMQVESKGQKALGDELGQLRLQNENLRITVGSLMQKPGRAEVRQLHIYDKAIRSLMGKSPGFGPAWEMVLKEAEEEVRRTETGLSAFIRRIFSPQASLPQPGKSIPEIEPGRKDDESGS
jgi:hypothetical protein